MKKFVIRLSAFIVIFIVVGYALQWVVDTGLKKTNFVPEYKEWYDITNSKINADIIILGSSKAVKQISPKDFEQGFKLSTYNLGMIGQCFPMQKWRFDVYLKYNKKPKYVIQIVAINEISNPVINYDYEQFIPYLHEGFIEKFGHRSFLDFRDFYIPLYKYGHKTGMMEAGLLGFFKKQSDGNDNYKGFLPINAKWGDTDLIALEKRNPHGIRAKINKVAYADYIDLIRKCKKEKIDLIFVNTPTPLVFQNLTNNREDIERIFRNFSAKYGLTYLDYSKDTICADKAMFYNFNHLNTRGVEIFNKQLIADLRSEIK